MRKNKKRKSEAELFNEVKEWFLTEVNIEKNEWGGETLTVNTFALERLQKILGLEN